ncbi:MAG: hypothetical protein K0U59_05365 [Gammaproteobacteria bacterium]|nr:hypothetical protein [Gammaproteobacteria bacterium]
MNELQRTEYLTTLGVTSYMPRFCLPQAPAPRQALLPSAPELEVSTESPTSLIIETTQTPAANHSVLPMLEQLRQATTIKTELTKPAQIPVAQVPPFVLSCWWLGDELLAVDNREPASALPVEALFGNILRALGWHQLAQKRDRLRWPLSENRYASVANVSDARDTCSSWLQAACARQPVKSIWLMGNQARDFCAPIPLSQPANDWQGVQILALPSLSELLQAPVRKSELWQLLQTVYPQQTRL